MLWALMCYVSPATAIALVGMAVRYASHNDRYDNHNDRYGSHHNPLCPP